MTTIVLFHSALGATEGFHACADVLRAEGHTVDAIDQYDGRTFADYGPAMEYVESVGFPALMATALDAASALPDGFVAIGFSNGAGMAQYVAMQRPGSRGVVCLGGAVPPEYLGGPWRADLPAQVHETVGDPFRDEGTEVFRAAATAVGADVEVFEYPGSGHLFADPSRPDEHQPAEAELMWSRVFEFVARVADS